MGRFERSVSIGVGLIFILSAYLKAVSPAETLQALRHLAHATGHAAAPESAMRALIIVEMVLGGFLLAGVAPRATLLAAAMTLGVFAAWITWLIWSGAAVGCGCGLRIPFLTGEAARFAALAKAALMSMACAAAALRLQRAVLTERMQVNEGALV